MERTASGAPIVAKLSATIELIMGPMFSGKTTRLIARITRYEFARKKCIIIRHKIDKRHATLQSHDGHVTNIAQIYCDGLNDKFAQILNDDYDVIGIDEAQFFAPDDTSAAKFAQLIDDACLRGKVIVCAGLDTDWLRRPFAYLAPIISRADIVTKLQAVCMKCGADASYSARVNDSARDNPIGGADKYVALCRQCHAHFAQTE